VFQIPIGGLNNQIDQYVIIQWGLMIAIILLALFLRSNLKEVPKGKQIWAEVLVEKLYKMVDDNMGSKYESFKPFIGTVFIFLFMMNMTGFFGFPPPTSSYGTCVGMAALTFCTIQATAIKRNGLIHYFTAFGKPFAMLLPVNLMERFTVPLSLSLRLFGNMMAGTVIVKLAYEGMGAISEMLHLHVPIFMTLLPIPVPFTGTDAHPGGVGGRGRP
jgi:F-type H+-transporting ATPase subunit a